MGTPTLQAAQQYASAGLSVIPVNRVDKLPAFNLLPRNAENKATWEPFRKRLATSTELQTFFRNGAAVAVVCGGVSGNLEGLDFDNKGHPDADELYESWANIVAQNAPELVRRLVVERTQSGGYHVFYRCATIAGNQKLAQRPPTPDELRDQPNLKALTLIETRGEGGYFVTSPTPGYHLIQGSPLDISTITVEEREILLAAAKALHRHVQPRDIRGDESHTDGGLRPGDDYNARGDALALLEHHGWTIWVDHGGDSYSLRRPGKRQGGSATYGVVAPKVLYVFSSNAAPFEPERAYKPFAVYAELEHNGDYKAAAKELARQGYGDQLQKRPVVRSEEPSTRVVTNEPDQRKADVADAAQLFGETHAHEWGYNEQSDAWYKYNGTHWEHVQTKNPIVLDNQMEDIFRRIGIKVSGRAVDDARRFARRYCTAIETPPAGLINFRNGTLDLTSKTLQPHDRKHGFTYCLPYDYAGQGETPIFDRLLASNTDDPAAPNVIMTHIGLALMRDTGFQNVVLLLGQPGSGKSTILRAINRLLGMAEYKYAPGMIYNPDREGSLQRGVCRDWHVTVMDEFPTEALKHEDLFKQMTAHEGVDSRLHQALPTNEQWMPKAIMAANDMPVFTDKTGAIRRRLIVITSSNVRKEADFDRSIMRRLEPEFGAFAAKCLAAAESAIAANCYPVSAAMVAKYDELATDNDPVKAFVAEMCVLSTDNANATVTCYSSELHEAYKDWAARNGHKEISNIALSRRITSYAPWRITKDRTAAGMRLSGIGLASRYVGLSTGNVAFEKNLHSHLSHPNAENATNVENVGFFENDHRDADTPSDDGVSMQCENFQKTPQKLHSYTKPTSSAAYQLGHTPNAGQIDHAWRLLRQYGTGQARQYMQSVAAIEHYPLDLQDAIKEEVAV